MVGTPLYMSPEAIAAPDAVDEKSDLYALGAVGYFLLSGTPVFEGDSVVEVCSHHLHTEPEPISSRASRQIPTDLEKIVSECLAKESSERPKSARDLCDKLTECSDAGRWTELDAEKWWAAHADRPEPAHKPSPRTLQIALDGRLRDSLVEGAPT
jgi:serine/threonine-protein kinase